MARADSIRERSIHFRLTVWYALILAAALGLFSGLLWLSLRQRLLSEVDRGLSDRAAQFQSYVMRESAEVGPENLKDEMEEFCQALPPSDYLELRGSRGFEFHFPSIATASPVPGRARTFHSEFRIGDESLQLQISSSLEAIDHTLDLLAILLFSLVPVVIVVACAGGAWLSRRALKPVDEITTAAQTIGIGNLSLRLRTPQTGDELQRLTEVWNVMLGRLEGAVKTLTQFAADASHELRTPLAVIRTSAELSLRRARTPESYRESLREISVEADRMTRLVEDLLFLARNDARESEMPMAALDVSVLVHDAVAEIGSLADVRGVSFRITGRRGAFTHGNEAALRRLFLVLLDNAIKYSRAGSEVAVAVEKEEPRITVAIQDFGIGISRADLPHIFKRFYQADPARADGGFGLGLSLAETIAQAHGATLDVRSEEGAGSTFEVVFRSANDEPLLTNSAEPVQRKLEIFD